MMVFLERGCKVGFVFLDESGVVLKLVAKCVEKRSLQSAEAVVKTGNVWFGKLETAGVTLGCEPVDVWSAGIRQSHHFRTFVECLAGGIIDCLPEDFHVIVVSDEDYLAIAPGDEKAYKRVGGDCVFLRAPDEMGEHVAVGDG